MKSKIKATFTEKYEYDVLTSTSDTITHQVLAAMVYGLHLKYHNEPKEVRQEKINEVLNATVEVLTMPPVFGTRIMADELQDKMAEEYGIDFDKIKTHTEEYNDFKARMKKTKLDDERQKTLDVMRGKYSKPVFHI